jgi:hypothetical protein
MMSEPEAKRPIPPEYRDAFNQAVAAFDNWLYGAPEPPISFEGKAHSIASICEGVMCFAGPAPDEIYNLVCQKAHDFRHGLEANTKYDCSGPKDDSYASVAECLLRLCAARTAWVKLKRERDF